MGILLDIRHQSGGGPYSNVCPPGNVGFLGEEAG
ncbi:hypothetical protein VTH06DRAFT_3601 [Thermothelomyces fergusii]